MVAEWYCDIDGEEHGPITAIQLKQLADVGKLRTTHSIWKIGMQKRVPARSVRGLFDPTPTMTTTADAAASTPTAVDKPAVPTPASPPPPPPKKEDEVVETQVAEDVVETQIAEDVVVPEPAPLPAPPVAPLMPMPVDASRSERRTERREERQPEPERRDRHDDRPRGRERNSGFDRAGLPSPIPPVAGKPFRVLCDGRIDGPFSLEDLKHMLATGRIAASDMIGVETWLPVATLHGVLAGGSPVKSRPAAAKTRVANVEIPDIIEDIEALPAPIIDAQMEAPVAPEVIEDIAVVESVAAPPPAPVKKEPEKKEAPKSDGDSIPVDEEFKF